MRETGTARRSERCPWEGHRRAPPPSHCVAARSPSAASGRSNHFIRTMDGRMVWSSGHLERESRVTVAASARAHTPVWARKCRLTCTKALERAPTYCIISRNGKRFLHGEDSYCWALPACRKGRSGRPGCRRPPSVRPVSRTRRSDPDRSSVTARAITAPARAGPEVVPRAGRATLHGRRAALRAGRPRLGPCGHFL